jgi:hypothetical protein
MENKYSVLSVLSANMEHYKKKHKKTNKNGVHTKMCCLKTDYTPTCVVLLVNRFNVLDWTVKAEWKVTHDMTSYRMLL